MNIWNFTGNLGKDSEVKYQKSGDAICTFSVAVSSGYGDNKKTTWANCALFGKQAASNLPQYLTQGTSVAVSGEVTLEEWQGQDGTKQKTLKVNVLKIDLIGSSNQKKEPQQDYRGHTGSDKPNPTSAPAQQAPEGFESFDDDIPF